jgi:hypothetical protein
MVLYTVRKRLRLHRIYDCKTPVTKRRILRRFRYFPVYIIRVRSPGGGKKNVGKTQKNRQFSVRKREKNVCFFNRTLRSRYIIGKPASLCRLLLLRGGCCHRHKDVIGSRQGFLSRLSLMSFAMLALNRHKTS